MGILKREEFRVEWEVLDEGRRSGSSRPPGWYAASQEFTNRPSADAKVIYLTREGNPNRNVRLLHRWVITKGWEPVEPATTPASGRPS
jgi:hypothetical protein